MADWTQVELNIEGSRSDIDLFLDEEIENFCLKDSSVRLKVDDLLITAELQGDNQVLIIGQQAWDEGETWLRSMRLKYPTLKFSGLVQTWHPIDV